MHIRRSRIENVNTAIKTGNNAKIRTDQVAVRNADTFIDAGDNLEVDLKRTTIELRDRLPNELLEALESDIRKGASADDLVKTYGDRLKPYVDLAALIARGVDVVAYIRGLIGF